MASRTTFGNPSERVGNTNRSAAARCVGTCSRSTQPWKVTLSPSPEDCASRAFRSDPSPRMLRRGGSTRRFMASMRWATPFTASRFPT